MKILAILLSAVGLAAYIALMRVDPSWGLAAPRGGLVMLTATIIAANVAIHFAAAGDAPLRRRFEVGAAGWIWLAVQAIGGWYMYYAWRHA
ncbi:hypothetical protein [Ottowia beijingensis]|uniref:hypothetical protein n=1 Tax=Ottowia beijingensis TaxID=1207057 RepID=UPI002FDB7ADB